MLMIPQMLRIKEGEKNRGMVLSNRSRWPGETHYLEKFDVYNKRVRENGN
jgi:hypothetical protein